MATDMLAVIIWSTAMVLLMDQASAYWEEGTTTVEPSRHDSKPRQSFFEWLQVDFHFGFWSSVDMDEVGRRRALCVVAGLSIDMLPITTGAILNRRTIITSSNAMEPYMDRQHDVRIWALGVYGSHTSPHRYRVWKIKRLLPKSDNPEHWHGIRGIHQPRHDIVLVFSQDQLVLYHYWPRRRHVAYKAFLTKRESLLQHLFMAGSGFSYHRHIAENYRILHAGLLRSSVVDCSFYLPKWWGKFICVKNLQGYAAVQSGGGLYTFGEGPTLFGLGCFEIRYNDDRIFVFTDVRYYFDLINAEADIRPGDYYEYAYPEYGTKYGWFYDSWRNYPVIATSNIKEGIYPLG